MGDNYSGQLGLGHNKYQNTFQRIYFSKDEKEKEKIKIEEIIIGNNFVYAFAQNNNNNNIKEEKQRIYCWGENEYS